MAADTLRGSGLTKVDLVSLDDLASVDDATIAAIAAIAAIQRKAGDLSWVE